MLLYAWLLLVKSGKQLFYLFEHHIFSFWVLDPQEEYVIRKVAGLLYVAHTDFIAAKLAATQS